MSNLILLLIIVLNGFYAPLCAQKKELLQNNAAAGVDVVITIDTIDLLSCPEENFVFLEVCNEGDQLLQSTLPITAYHNDPRILTDNPRFLAITDYNVSIAPGACLKLPAFDIPLLNLTGNNIPNDGNLYFVVNDNTRNFGTGDFLVGALALPNSPVVESDYTNNFHGPVSINDCNFGTLPVELKVFKSTLENRTVHLNWNTLSELNNSHFIIQHSQDGVSFTNIGEVAGHGTAIATNHYEFWDMTPQKGVNYYRLKQVDYDGSYTYSKIIAEQLEDLNVVLHIYPNPAQGSVMVELIDKNIEQVQLKLINELGQVVKMQSVNMSIGTVELHVEDLPRGVYHLLLVNEKGLSIARSVILN